MILVGTGEISLVGVYNSVCRDAISLFYSPQKQDVKEFINAD